ncbi:unnamed protein product [Prorocentrum cordatum]|uniref:Uncharacterized protein n=1 Tax=Prorocentrum cordatum TaxID=2364126 RepID=A0ABN9SXJ0_9DINO|nr:unnamed protein product [Polarella glacialis]
MAGFCSPSPVGLAKWSPQQIDCSTRSELDDAVSFGEEASTPRDRRTDKLLDYQWVGNFSEQWQRWDTPRTVRLVFQGEERGVPSLHRGWRTPATPRRCGRGAGSPRRGCRAARRPCGWRRRTRSRQSPAAAARRPPPGPASGRPPRTSPTAPPRTPRVQGRRQVLIAWEPYEIACTPCGEDGSAEALTCTPCDADGTLPSAGSLGHPYTCAEACKYASRSRGCKDGAACDRCHLCEWKRRPAAPAPPPIRAPTSRRGGAPRRRNRSRGR